jgi:hypothetical protein
MRGLLVAFASGLLLLASVASAYVYSDRVTFKTTLGSWENMRVELVLRSDSIIVDSQGNAITANQEIEECEDEELSVEDGSGGGGGGEWYFEGGGIMSPPVHWVPADEYDEMTDPGGWCWYWSGDGCPGVPMYDTGFRDYWANVVCTKETTFSDEGFTYDSETGSYRIQVDWTGKKEFASGSTVKCFGFLAKQVFPGQFNGAIMKYSKEDLGEFSVKIPGVSFAVEGEECEEEVEPV